ncbi:MAG: UDP-N-acetylmuramate dehydrogenase [Gammaproteobacteria bacterium]|nr:UDP-N-acetylmuramate dehydrogenase [Gammaproteobacteria bacterium]
MTVSIQYNKDLQALNTLTTPAVADAFCAVHDNPELDEALAYARREQLLITVLGEGSNVVLGDTLPGLVLHLRNRGREVLGEDSAQVTLAVAGGESWHSLVRWCLQQGYHGLENLALIPGTVGAAPIQNIGAYGVEVERFIVSVNCRDLGTGEPVIFQREECKFGYRDSIFKGELRDRMIVEQVVFCLPKQVAPVLDYPSLASYLQAQDIAAASPRQVFAAVVAIRSSRLPNPRLVPNVGSFFKNPILDPAALQALQVMLPDVPHYARGAGHYVVPAAHLIAASGIRSRTDLRSRNGAPVSLHPDHALVIINPDHCSAAAVQRYAGHIVAAVDAQFGIRLEQEPRSYG